MNSTFDRARPTATQRPAAVLAFTANVRSAASRAVMPMTVPAVI
jgi:hypothetical protein